MTLAFVLPLLLQSAEPLPECNQEEADLGIQPAMNQCAWRDFRIADAELNAQWKVTVAAIRSAMLTMRPTSTKATQARGGSKACWRRNAGG